jgi:hypothetical protein
MASHGKKKTTMAKLNREARLRERRVEKAARKVERKQQAERGPEPADGALEDDEQLASDPDRELVSDPDVVPG